MSTHGDEIAFLVNVETQIIRNLTISRYFGAAGLALLFYDTMITMEVEVSGYLAQPRYTHSLFVDSPRLARAPQNSEGALLYQPVLVNCVLGSCQLP